MSPDLSVGIVNWNTKDYLRGCLNSIRDNLKGLTYEVIVADNNSNDASCSMVRGEFPWVNLIENRINLGYAKANNRILKAAGGDKLLLLNPDILILGDSLRIMADFLDAHKNCAALAPKYLNPDGSFQRFYRRLPGLKVFVCKVSFISSWIPAKIRDRIINRYEYALPQDNFDRVMELEQPAASCLMFKTAVLRDAGLFDERFPLFFNDVDLCGRLRKKGYKIFFTPEARVIHYLGKSRDISKYLENKEFIIGWLRYFKKSRGLPIYLSARFMILCHTVISAAYYLLSPVTDIKKIEDKRKALKLCWEMLLERSFFQA